MLKVVLAGAETPYAVLVSERGRAIVFEVSEVSVLMGPGKGVRGIKLDKGDRVVAAALSRGKGDAIRVETTKGGVKEVAASSRGLVARGGKGRELVKRDRFVREVPAPVEIPILDSEGGDGEGGDMDEEAAGVDHA